MTTQRQPKEPDLLTTWPYVFSLIKMEAQIKAEVRAEMPGLSEEELEEATRKVWVREAKGELLQVSEKKQAPESRFKAIKNNS